MGLGSISLQSVPGHGMWKDPPGNNLANAQARAPLPIVMLSGLARKKEESTSTNASEALLSLIPWHTKKEVSGDGDPPPPPACATVADNAKIPITASALKAALLFMVFLLGWSVPARHVPKRSFEASFSVAGIPSRDNSEVLSGTESPGFDHRLVCDWVDECESEEPGNHAVVSAERQPGRRELTLQVFDCVFLSGYRIRHI